MFFCKKQQWEAFVNATNVLESALTQKSVQILNNFHTFGLGVTASKLWNIGVLKLGGSKTIYAPLFLYLSSVACNIKNKEKLGLDESSNVGKGGKTDTEKIWPAKYEFFWRFHVHVGFRLIQDWTEEIRSSSGYPKLIRNFPKLCIYNIKCYIFLKSTYILQVLMLLYILT